MTNSRRFPRAVRAIVALAFFAALGPLAARAQEADLLVTKTDTPDPVSPGSDLTYTITVRNLGPDAASSAAWSDNLPAGTFFVSLAAAPGWSCTDPGTGFGGTVSCSIDPLPVDAVATFTLVVTLDEAVGCSPIVNTASASTTTFDPDVENDAATATTASALPCDADLALTKSDSADPVAPGAVFDYTITVANLGPGSAQSPALSDDLPAGTTFVSLSSPAGWTCTTPAFGANGTVACGAATLDPGNAVFTITVQADAALTPGTQLSNTATVSTSTTDPNPGDEADTEITAIEAAAALLGLVKDDSPDPVAPGGNLTYTLTTLSIITDGTELTLQDTLPADTTFVSLAVPGGWSCSTPAQGAAGDIQCSRLATVAGSATFTLVVAVDPGAALGSVVLNQATLSHPASGRQVVADEDTAVLSPATLTATKTVAGGFLPASGVSYTLVLTNAGPANQVDAPGDEFTDVVLAPLALVSATATSGTAFADVGTNTVTWNGTIPAGGSVTITIQATLPSTAIPGATISNQGALAFDADGDGVNEASGVTDDPSTAAANDPTSFLVARQSAVEIPAAGGVGLALFAGLLAIGAVMALRGQR